MKRTILTVLGLAVIASVAALVLLGRGADVPAGMSRTTTHQIRDLVQGEVVEHTFILSNEEPEDIRISEVLPWATTVIEVDSVIPAGGEARVRVRLDTQDMTGALNEIVKVRFAHEEGEEGRIPIWLQLRGRVLSTVHIEPSDRVYFFTVRGEEAERDLELINHRDEPLEVLDVVSSNPLFTVRTREAESGRRYELTIGLDPSAPPGRHEGMITVSTDSPEYASMEIRTLARIEEVVSTSVTEVDFGLFSFDALNLSAVSRRTVLVEKHEGTDFEVVRASSDLPFLKVEVEPKDSGRSYLVSLEIQEDRVERGSFSGTLVIETNDPAFPRFELPIVGEGV